MTGSKMQRGFTLLEVLVALGIFAGLLTVGVTIYMQVIRLQRETVRTQQAAQDFRYVMDFMSRDLRKSIPQNPQGFDTESNVLTLKSAEGTVAYYVGDATGPKTQDVCADSATDCKLYRRVDSGTALPLTGVQLKGLSTNTHTGNGVRSVVTIVLTPKDSTTQSFQTTISSRAIEEAVVQ